MQQLKNLGAGGIIICNSLLTVIPFDTNQCNRHIKFRQEFTLKELDGRYPPKFIHSHKKKVYAALPPLSNEVLNEKVQVTKWDCIDYPDDIPIKSVAHQMFQDSFPYNPSAPGTTEWYVNFADSRLFGFYENSLFAQDEMQVMEHPCLASVRIAMSKISDSNKNATPYTRSTYSGHIYSTPVLIKGAKRRVCVATNVNEEAGRPFGLAFAQAEYEVVAKALTFFDPPTTTNLIAIEAPKDGRYSREQIGDAFGTAYTGFYAAKLETLESNPNHRVVVHTGNWGTGAFGGNRILMATIQLLASQVAQVDELVFHTFEPSATDAYIKGKALYEEILATKKSTHEALETLLEKEFQWGFSDGN